MSGDIDGIFFPWQLEEWAVRRASFISISPGKGFKLKMIITCNYSEVDIKKTMKFLNDNIYCKLVFGDQVF